MTAADFQAAGQQLYDATDGNSRATAASRWEDVTGALDGAGQRTAGTDPASGFPGVTVPSEVPESPGGEQPAPSSAYVYDRLDDSGGSSFLCDCSGVDTGVHEPWCKSLGNPDGNTP